MSGSCVKPVWKWSIGSIFVALACMSLDMNTFAASPPNQDEKVQKEDDIRPLLTAMEASDAKFQQSFTMAFRMDVPRRVAGPEPGVEHKLCRFTSSGDKMGMSIECTYDGDPLYKPPGTRGYRSGDYDEDGNLIVWRSLRKFALRTSVTNSVYDEQQMLLIGPDGRVVSELRRGYMYKYPVGSRDSIYELDHALLAVGHDFTRRLRQYESDRPLENNRREIIFRGNHGDGLEGHWHIQVASPADDYLVREAKFMIEDHDPPAIRMENTGLIKNEGFSLAESGLLAYALNSEEEFVMKISVIEISRETDRQLLDELHALLTVSPAPQQGVVEIIDFTKPSPLRYAPGKEPE